MTPGPLYLPEWGQPMSRSLPENGFPERVLHLGLATRIEELYDLTRALGRFGSVKRLIWCDLVAEKGTQQSRQFILDQIRQYRPTLIWMQVQASGFLSDLEFLRAIKAASPRNCLLVEWTGDVADHDARAGVAEWTAPWMFTVAQGVDLFTACQCNYPQALHQAGVPCACGFHQCGVDLNLYTRKAPDPNHQAFGELVWLATRYPHVTLGERDALAQNIVTYFPQHLVCYGGGWSEIPGVRTTGGCTPEESPFIYASASLAMSISLHSGMRRYTSDRLPRILASGGVALTRAFPDMEGLGLVDGVNCLVWHDTYEVLQLIRDWLQPTRELDREAIRRQAHELGHQRMGWDAAIEELAYMVQAERKRRNLYAVGNG